MRFIDFHTHIYPDAIAHKAAESIRDFYSLGDRAIDGKAENLIKLGTEAGVSEFVVLPVAIQPQRTRHINDFILEQLEKEPRFYGYGTVHAAMDNLEDEVAYIIEKGLRGIKIHPDSQVFDIDDPRLFPMYEMIQDKLPIIIHMGDLRYDYSRPEKLRHILDLFPRLQAIAAHFGGYQMHQLAAEVLHDKNCFFDVSSSLMFMAEGEAEHYIRYHGADRFVYGSDFPMWNPVTEMQRFLKLSLTHKEQEQIAHKTALELLKL